MRYPSSSILALSLPVLLLSACSAEKSEDAAAAASEAATDAKQAPAANAVADQAGPGIDRAVAPGVAFTYAYAFTLPVKAISSVQQEHSAACAKLGPTRCRVTGVTYTQPSADEARGQLDFLLAPDLAYAFANEGIAAVEKADGQLQNGSVNGRNAGDAITLSQQDSAATEAEIARIELRLKSPGLTKGERVELQQQIAGLHEQQRGSARDRKAMEASIATTPVTFTYTSEGLVGGSNTFGRAATASWNSAETAFSFAALVAGIALPWVLLIGLGVFVWRKLRRRVTPITAEPTAMP
ncbi:MAG: DUF4349 domain-containing protein [Proteobacteria bacterium]|nr:DUF4349 domain-containing protein [Pseudomonadota bacterium]